jgi:hypothetical protein
MTSNRRIQLIALAVTVTAAFHLLHSQKAFASTCPPRVTTCEQQTTCSFTLGYCIAHMPAGCTKVLAYTCNDSQCVNPPGYAMTCLYQ